MNYDPTNPHGFPADAVELVRAKQNLKSNLRYKVLVLSISSLEKEINNMLNLNYELYNFAYDTKTDKMIVIFEKIQQNEK